MNEERIVLREQRDLSRIIEAAFQIYLQSFWPLFAIAAVVIPLGIGSSALQANIEDSVTTSVVPERPADAARQVNGDGNGRRRLTLRV